MAPRPWATISGAITRQVRKVEVRWASISSLHCSSVTFRMDDCGGSAIPAQLIKTSTDPYALTAASASASATPGTAAEPETAIACPPASTISCATVSEASRSRPLTTTPAPSAASAWATDRPIPRLDPVTTAPRPARCFARCEFMFSTSREACIAMNRAHPVIAPNRCANYSPDICPVLCWLHSSACQAMPLTHTVRISYDS